MQKEITITVPEPLLSDLGQDWEAMVQDIFLLGARHFRMRRALEMY